MKPETRLKRFFSKIVFSDGCCEWRGKRNKDGYGTFVTGPSTAPEQHFVHRFSWEVFNGPIPEGVCVLHNCDNRACAKPTHLFLGTRDINNKDRMQKGRSAKGQASGKCKLSDQDLQEIYHSSERGVDLAKKYGVNKGTICRIRKDRYPRMVLNA
jgi:hypothetical protein